jgi:hypothetical protein
MIYFAIVFAALTQTPLPAEAPLPAEPENQTPDDPAPSETPTFEDRKRVRPASGSEATSEARDSTTEMSDDGSRNPLVPREPRSLADGDWNVGAGVGFVLLGNGLGGGLGGLGGPRFSAGLERRLGDRLWFTIEGDVVGSAVLADDRFNDEPSGAWSAGARLTPGIRYQLVDDSWRVRPSVLAGISGGVDLGRTIDSANDLTIYRDRTHWDGGLQAGGAVDVSLTESITLRLASTVAHVAVVGRADTTEVEDADGERVGDVQTNNLIAIEGGLQLAPQLQLRVFF